MIVVVDASVAIKWFVSVKPDEDHADRALEILERSIWGKRSANHILAPSMTAC